MMETLTGIRRAGADMIITYYAREAARVTQCMRRCKNTPCRQLDRKLFARATPDPARRRRQPGSRVQAVGGTPLFISRGAGAIIETSTATASSTT